MVFVRLAWNSEIPFRAALARRFFEQQGLQIEPILIRGGPAAIAARVSGEVDFAAIGGAQAVFRSRARGLDISIIGCPSSTTNYILLGDRRTRTIEVLRRKTIGITGAGLQQMLDEDIRNAVVEKTFTLPRVVNDRILKIAQQGLRAEGKIR